MFNSAETVRIVGSTLVGFCCWGIGYFGLSFFLMVLFMLLNIVKARLYSKREKRQTALQLMGLKEKEIIEAQIQDLPAWVRFPDTERVEWINKIAFQLWPFIGEYVRSFVMHTVQPQVKASMPGAFKSFVFEEIDMGELSPRVVGVKTYKGTGKDRIILDLDIVYAGDCEFVVAVGAFEAGLRSVRFKGKLRLILTPLLAKPPMVGGVRAFFMDDPDIDFELTGVGELAELPGLMGAIRSVVTSQVRERCVVPNEIAVALSPDTDMSQLLFSEPEGIMIVHVVEAKNLEQKDVKVFGIGGKSDPYVVCTAGSQIKTTKVIENRLNPVWNEYFQLTVDEAAGQTLMITLFDQDQTGDDEELGYTQIDIGSVKKDGTLDTWLQLDGVKHGEIHLDLRWMYLSSDRSKLTGINLPSKIRLDPALLMVYIDSITNLTRIRKSCDPHPYLEMVLGSRTKQTLPRIDTRNPIFQKKYHFWVEDPTSQILTIEVKDKETDKSLGEVSIQLYEVLTADDMEIKEQTWALSQPSLHAKIKMALRLRVISSEQVKQIPENKNKEQ